MILEIKIDGKYQQASDVACKEVDEEIFIVLGTPGISATKEALFTLTGTGKIIWQLLDGTNSVQQVIEHILQEYDAKEYEVKQDVVAFMEMLAARGLIME